MSIEARVSRMLKITHCFLQAEVTVIIPKINAMIEKKIGVRLCTRLFVRP